MSFPCCMDVVWIIQYRKEIKKRIKIGETNEVIS